MFEIGVSAANGLIDDHGPRIARHGVERVGSPLDGPAAYLYRPVAEKCW
jgi:hypothetical protein